jgi:hypothetical protein
MDKELAQLHDLARTMLLEVQAMYEAKILPPGFGKSDKKRLDKAISNLDFNPEAYVNIMEDVMAGNKGAKELMKRIRNVETNVMKAFELLNEDTIHHLVQQRTGGDFSKQVSGDVVRGAIKRLEDRFGLKFSQATGPGGVIRGDTALSNFAHKSDLTQKGAELASGIGKNPDPSTTAHRLGTSGYSKTLSPQETRDEQALFEALEARIASQLEDVKVGIATDQPRVQAIRAADPRLANAYMATNTAEEIAAMQPIARGLAENVKIETYQQLRPDFKGGKAILKATPLLGLGSMAVLASQQAMAGDLSEAAFTVGTGVIGEVPVVGDVAAEFIEGTPVASGELTPAKADPQAYVKQALQEKEQRGKEFSEFVQLAKQRPSTTINPKELERQRLAEEARQRGGKVKFGFGGVKFTLPEFGLSELMGIN